MAIQLAEHLFALHQMLDALDQAPETDEVKILREHLQSAHTFLLGSMPREYKADLDLAGETVALMGNPGTRVKQILTRLRHEA